MTCVLTPQFHGHKEIRRYKTKPEVTRKNKSQKIRLFEKPPSIFHDIANVDCPHKAQTCLVKLPFYKTKCLANS